MTKPKKYTFFLQDLEGQNLVRNKVDELCEILRKHNVRFRFQLHENIPYGRKEEKPSISSSATSQNKSILETLFSFTGLFQPTRIIPYSPIAAQPHDNLNEIDEPLRRKLAEDSKDEVVDIKLLLWDDDAILLNGDMFDLMQFVHKLSMEA
jgi:hypothetical protein